MHKLTERIKINNSPISYSLFNFYFSKVWKIVPIMHKEINQMPTFFEFITLLALVIFKEENVEISIIEVGLGGRLDSTNVIESDISVITGISRDHTKILGNTLIKISNEKAGIIKSHIPVVIGEKQNDVSNVFIRDIKDLSLFFNRYKAILWADLLPIPGSFEISEISSHVFQSIVRIPRVDTKQFHEVRFLLCISM